LAKTAELLSSAQRQPRAPASGFASFEESEPHLSLHPVFDLQDSSIGFRAPLFQKQMFFEPLINKTVRLTELPSFSENKMVIAAFLNRCV
jgi:hypothetical protein